MEGTSSGVEAGPGAQPGEMGLQQGATGEWTVTVTEEMVADRFSNAGVRVVATPFLIWLIEGAAVRAVEEHLRPGEATVGTGVNVRHVAAAPIGAEVTARAEVSRVDGRRLGFAVSVRSGDTMLMVGEHERHVVDLRRFLAGLDEKRPAP